MVKLHFEKNQNIIFTQVLKKMERIKENMHSKSKFVVAVK
jgi:hypothetical protein